MTDRPISRGHRPPGLGGDYDPETIPVRNAATILILDDQPNLSVLMLKRNSRSAFVGDMWVFPGGAVDPGDATSEADALVVHLTDPFASRQLGLDSGGLAYWVAALRETFEEAGVMLTAAGRAAGTATMGETVDAATSAELQDQVNAGELDFLEAVRSQGLTLNGGQVHYVARWVTPVGAPRRYDTRFFVTRMPSDQRTRLDNDEAVHHEWVEPSHALQANTSGDMLMMTPTLGMLARLATFASADAAMAAAAAGTATDDEEIRIRYETEGPHRIAFPADSDYDDADRTIELGSLRWPQASA